MIKIKKTIRQFFFSWIVKRQAAEVGIGLKVNFYSQVTNTTYLGNNVNFNGISITGGGKVTIGDNFHSGRFCEMISQNHNYEGDAIPYDRTYILKDITIGDNVWIGDRVIILGGATIGEGAIIQAGSVVCGNIPPFAICGGHPAKQFSMRDKEHYLTLKALGKVH